MSDNNFIVNLTAKLHSKSKQQIESDAKNLGDIKVPLVGTLDQAKTSAQLKQDVASLKTTVDINGKVNTKNITSTVQQSAKQAQKTADANTIQFRTSLKKDKLINDIRVFGQQNSKLFKDAEMSSKFSSLLDNAKLATSNKEIKNLRMQLSAMRSEAKATNLSGLTLGDSVKKTFRRATELFTGTAGVMMLSRQLKNAWNEALDLDKAFTDLIKVNDELSRGDYDKYLERCNEKAQDLAATQKSLMEGATEFSKSGYNLSESNALAEKSTILANVGDMSTSDSAKAIISGVQAYKDVDGFTDAVNKAGALIDKYNEIGNTASITSAEIAQGVQTVGSVFADANTSVDEFIALLSAGNRQFQNADTLALSLRTAALRIRGCKSELESLGESTENVYTSSSKLADKIESLTNIDGNGGVKILEVDNKTFRSIYDIFVDLSKVYQQMSDVDQSALLDLIAGKNRASGISATLNNMSEAQDIYERSLHSTGSAQREYDKYLESSEASLNRFKASMTETYQSVINGQTVTGLLNCGNAALQFANSIGLVESSLKGLLTIGIIKVLTTVTTAFRASAIQASNFGTALSAVKSMSTLQSGTTEYTNALNTLKAVSASLTETQLKHILSNDALNESERVRILRSTGLSKTQAKAKLAEMELTQATQKQAVANQKASLSTFSLSSAVKGLGQNIKMAVMNNPVAVAVMTVSAIAGVVKAIKKHKQAQEEAFESAKKNAQDAQSKIKSLQSEIKQNADTVDQAGKKYAELAQGVNQLTGKNISLSDDEYKEFLDVSNQLAEVFPQLTKGYDDNGNAILDLQGNVDGITGKLKDLLEIEQQLAQQEINKNIDTYFENQSKVFGKEAKGQNDTIDTQTEKIDKYKKALDNFNESISNNKPASNFESELDRQTYYADFLADMEKANIDIADAIISQDGTSATEYNFAKLSKETQEQIRQYYAGIISTANTEMRSAESQLSTSNAEFASYVNMWMQNSSGSYLAMTGNDEMQSALSSIVSGLNWGDILQGDDFSGLSGEELESAIETNILVPLQSAMANADTGDQFKQVITDALTISDDDISLEESKNRIEAYVQEINDVLGDALGKPLTASDLGMQKYLDNYEMLMDGVSANASKFVSTTDKEFSDAKRNLEGEYQKISDWGLDEYANKIKEKTIQTKFGNVDMDKRTIIYWSNELKKTYADALASWDYDPEIGSIDTVYGMSDRFGENLNGTGWEVAFTPILPDGTFLSKDTVYQYINSIIDKAYDNDHQITHSELKDLDKQGMKIGDTFVHGIYAAFDKNTNYDNNNNWADVVGRLMHFSGQDGAIQLAENAMASMTTLDKSKESLMNFANKNSINTEAEIQTWNRIMSESETREEAMQRYLNQSAITSYDSSFDPSTAYEAMNNALSEQSSQGYLTEETLNGLKTAYGDLSKIITYTSSGIQLNTEYMANYTEQTAKAALIANQLKEANAVDQYNKEISALKKVISTQVKDTNVRTKLNKAYAKGVDALKDEIKNLGKDNDSLSTHLDNISAIQDEINGYDALEQSIMATLSSLNQYKKALETPDQNDNFLYAQSQIESMQDAYDKGWTQTDQFKEWMNYIGTFNEQLEYSDEEIQQYMARTKRYMTDDISGLYNYLDDASKLSDQIIKNVDGSYDIQVQNIGKLAEQMNMSVSQTMDILMSMSNADGFNITFDNLSDSIEKNLNEISGVNAEARQQIEESREEIEALKKAGYDTSELEDLYNSVIQEHAGDVPEISLYAHLSSLSLDDLEKEAQDAADAISKDTSINLDVDLNPKSAKDAQNQIDQLVAKRDNFDVGSEQWNNIQTVLTDLLVKKQELEQPTIMKLDLTDVQDSYQQTVAILQQYIEAKNALESAQTLGIDTTDAESKLSSITEKLQSLESDGKLKTIGIDAEINTDEFYKQIEALNTDKLKKDNAKISVDANTTPYEQTKNKLIQDTNKETASIKIKANTTNFYTNLQQQLQTHVFTVNVKGQITGVSGGTVTSHGNSRSKAIKNGVIMGNPRKKTSKSKASAAGTTAYVDGIRNGQIAYDQQALVGEVAPELLVRNGEAQLIGQRGAEFKNLKKGDVIFNHIDTAKLLSGDDGVRGKLIGGSFANGTTISNAYATSTQRATGSAKANTRFHGSSGSGSSSNSSGSNDSSAQDKADEFLETIDWIEVKINRCEEAIARLNKTEENTFSGWTFRTTALNDEIAKTADEIEWATQGYKRYLQQADSVALSEDYKRKVRNGEINIEDITDEDLYNKIQDYQNWYEKAVELQDKIQELNISLSELAQKKFDNIVTQFEDMESEFTSLNDIIDKLVDYAETKGRIISKSYYEAMLQNENENNKLLVQQRDQMVAELNELVNTGKVTEYSEAWYDLQQQIDEVNGSIVESNKSIQEFYNNMRQADWDLFDLVQDKITGIADEIEFVQSLLDDRDNLTDGHLNRGLTNEGIAQLGNYASKYNIYMSQAEKYASEIKKIEADIAKDPANQDLINRKEELVKAQRDVILSANDERKSMIDLARDGYDAVLEVLQDLIDKKKEALSSTKDLYEYQKDIASKTKDLATLEKEASVYENDNSEEALKKVQQIKVDIESKKQELSDAEYDKYIEDQEKMLDDLYQEYSDKIDEKFEQTEILIQELIGVVNENQSSISDTITTVTSDVGYTISDQMKTIWNDAGTVISGFTGKFDTYATTVQSAINSIQVTIDKMLQIAQAEANKNIATANNPNGVANGSTSNGSTASKPQATPKANANNNSSATQAPKASPNVGTRVNATGNWYYDSYGTAPTGNVNRFKPDYFEIDKIANGRAYPYHIQAIIKGKRAGGNGWVKGNQIGYKNGLKEATYDHLAWTQEEGAEIIRRSDGSILTPITRGTTVFTREMTDNLWNIAKQNPEKFYQNAMPTMNTFATTNRGGDVTVSIGDIKLDGIQNPDQFAQALIGVVKDYSKVQKVLQAATVDLVAGKSIKDINRF